MELLPTTDATGLGNILLDPDLSATIPLAIQEAIRLSLSNSITFLFAIGAVIVLLSLITSALIRKVPLKSAEEYYDGRERPASGEKEATVGASEVSGR